MNRRHIQKGDSLVGVHALACPKTRTRCGRVSRPCHCPDRRSPDLRTTEFLPSERPGQETGPQHEAERPGPAAADLRQETGPQHDLPELLLRGHFFQANVSATTARRHPATAQIRLSCSGDGSASGRVPASCPAAREAGKYRRTGFQHSELRTSPNTSPAVAPSPTVAFDATIHRSSCGPRLHGERTHGVL